MGTLHCTLENGVDLYVNEPQKIRQYRSRSTEERRRIRRRYTDSIGNQPYNTMVVFKMRDSIPNTAFVMYCVYGESRSSLYTYRVYRLYDMYYNYYCILM